MLLSNFTQKYASANLRDVLIIGEVAFGHLPWLCVRGFERLGVSATILGTDTHPLERWRHVRHPLPVVAADALQRAWVNRRLLAEALSRRPDVILVIKGAEIRPAVLREIKNRTDAVLVNWNPDSPLNPLNSSRDLIEATPLYDCHFTWGRFLIPELRRLGARRVEYLPFAFDPDLHRPAALAEAERARWASAVVFAGTRDASREEHLRELLSFDLGVWGRLWERLPPGDPLRARWRGVAEGADLVPLLSACQIALNFVRAQNGSAHNMRTFEAPACGAFMLATCTEEHVELFGEGRGAVFFSDSDELREKVAYYLRHPDERVAIARKGWEIVQTGHTYADRMAQVLTAVQ